MPKLNGTLLTGFVLGVAFVATGVAVASYGLAAGRGPKYAEVVDVQPVTRSVRVPREVCVDVGPAKRAGAQHAAAERRCRTVHANVARVVAYEVQYRLGTELGSARLPRDPGDRVLVEEGRVSLVEATRDDASAGDSASG